MTTTSQARLYALVIRLIVGPGALSRWRLVLGCMSLGWLLSACAPTTRVVLLPQADKTASEVVVRSTTSQVVLNVPYQRASSTGADTLKGDTVTPEDIQRKYLGLFTAAPPRPLKFILNFLPGGTTLTPEF